MATMPSAPSYPDSVTPSYLRGVFFGPSTGALASDSLNSVLQEMSYGKTSATGDVFGPFALAQDYTSEQLSDFEAAAMAAAASLVDFTEFKRIIFVFPPGAPWGAFGTIGCGYPVDSIADLPMGSRGILVTIGAHEFGHNLGLGHADSESFGDVPLGAIDDPGGIQEYGDPFSTMGFINACGDERMSGQYSAQHKSQILHWLTAGDYREVTTPGTFTLAPLELSSGLRALRVLRDSRSGAWLWVEYRQPIGDVDSSLSLIKSCFGESLNIFDGALIYYENPLLPSYPTYLLSFDPASGGAYDKYALVAGRSWSDPYSPLTLTVNSATPTGLSVTVDYAQPCATLDTSGTVFPASGGIGTLTISANAVGLWTCVHECQLDWF